MPSIKTAMDPGSTTRSFTRKEVPLETTSNLGVWEIYKGCFWKVKKLAILMISKFQNEFEQNPSRSRVDDV